VPVWPPRSLSTGQAHSGGQQKVARRKGSRLPFCERRARGRAWRGSGANACAGARRTPRPPPAPLPRQAPARGVRLRPSPPPLRADGAWKGGWRETRAGSPRSDGRAGWVERTGRARREARGGGFPGRSRSGARAQAEGGRARCGRPRQREERRLGRLLLSWPLRWHKRLDAARPIPSFLPVLNYYRRSPSPTEEIGSHFY
jgi:hypothetical protein